MKTVRNYFAILIGVLVFSFVSVSAQSYSNTSARSTRNIEQKVFKKLIGLPYYGVFDHITFQVQGSTVILDGKVNSLGTKRDAASALKNVQGVEKVINNIDQLPPSSFDNRIRQQALRSFTSRGPAQYFYENDPDVRIIVENGRITLEGYVRNSSDSNTLNILANSINGVFRVTNNLVVGKNAAR